MYAAESAYALIQEYDLIPPGSTVLCAVSGGADSVCLLHILYGLQAAITFTLVAAHYNHNLRGAESDRDEQFVRDFIAAHLADDPPRLFVGSGDVAAEAKRRGRGIEETAREMRYAFLRQTAREVGADAIAVAHNADDNAETVLLHLIRGCGLRGLTGIRPRQGDVVRPLLTTTRAEIERYLRDHHLPHVEDSSNSDDAYSRNKVRHQIIPLLNEINPWFVQRMADTARLLRTDEDFIMAQAEDACAAAHWEGGEVTIPAAVLAGLPDAAAPRCARRLIGMLREGNDDCSAAHLDAVVALARGDDPSASVDLPGGLLARRVYGNLVLGPRREKSELPAIGLDPETAQTVESGPWRVIVRPAVAPSVHPEDLDHVFLAREAIRGALALRPRRTGDELSLPKRGRKTVKKLFIDAKVPRLEREHWPVLADDSGILYVPGFGPDAARLAAPGQDSVEILSQKID